MGVFANLGKVFQVLSGLFFMGSTLYMIFGPMVKPSPTKETLTREVLVQELQSLEALLCKYREYERRGWVSRNMTKEIVRVMESHQKLIADWR